MDILLLKRFKKIYNRPKVTNKPKKAKYISFQVIVILLRIWW
jgi:hypothetical protein